MPLLGNCLKALYFDSLYTTKHLIVLFIQEDSAPGNEGEELRVDEDRGDPTSPTEDDFKELIAPKKSAVQKKRD